MIQVENITYQIGKKQLVKDLSFEAKSGELLAVLGANGAGKSTLMKLLCREISPVYGNILLRGQELKQYKLPELARQRAVLAQQNTISISFIVNELVMMGRYPHFEHQPGLHDAEVVKKVMEETGITHLSGRDYNTLSGGEQQRVQLARVLAQIYDCPDACLFLDEPTNGLDLLYQQQVMELARSLADRGYCVICILHDINFASRFADKILMLKDGQKVAMGTPLEVINCENIHETFSINVKLMACEGYNCPLVIPATIQT
ncbi:iron complex transport system ATP-binding protein [Pedobacter cryoconitis]|uniref:Iron complex transport system ATP-binding protein n=1 Tax=Pedobacter cryoconitis TaxID=188932 RepID=A0A7W8ZJ97_9SPHI|nr:heme ABC transporter ATP-binding protein [Pedobacter cryoconitis]MBB5634860.1 iron complex transport system ATP-binding protein [Pedobacter cryoconitis]